MVGGEEDNDVAMLAANDTAAGQLHDVCKHSSPQQFVDTFTEVNCLNAATAGVTVEYAEDDEAQRRESLCLLGADSYDDRTMITMDHPVSMVCDGQTTEEEC